jgi:hypothetical protein
MSNTILAAVKPRKCIPPGLNMKLMTVAMSPTIEAAPNFLTHQTVMERTANPIISQRIGNPNVLNTIGEKIEFSTPHRADNKAIAATSRVLKYGISLTLVLRNTRTVTPYIKTFCNY